MLELLGDILIYGFAVAASPIPLIAVLLLLRSPSGRGAGTVFLLARMVVLTTVALIVALLAESLSGQGTGTAPVVTALRIVLGLGLIALAIRKWALRPRAGDPAPMPKWMASVGESSVAGAARIGIVISALNPKELAFGAGAGLTIGAAHLSAGLSVTAALAYAFIACIGVVLAVVAVWVAGERMAGPMAAAESWLVQNYSIVLGAVLLMIGVTLVGEGLGAI